MERRADKAWHCTWAFPLTQTMVNHEGFETTKIHGRVDVDNEYPGCPYCGAAGWVSCGACGKLTCWNTRGRKFTCAWCGNTGLLGSGGDNNFDLNGGAI